MDQGSAAHQRALVAQEQAAVLRTHDEERLSELRGAAAAFEFALQEASSPEPQLELISMLKGAEGALREVIELKQRLTLAEAELQRWLYDSDSLYVGSMARQLENKLYRLCRRREPGEVSITPIQAEFASLEIINLEEGTINRSAYETIQGMFPNLEVTVEELRDLGNSSEHPWLLHDSTTGEDRPVTKEDLQACIDRRFHSSVFKEDIETVLACLDYLSKKMAEPLFVPITQEQAAVQPSGQAAVQR